MGISLCSPIAIANRDFLRSGTFPKRPIWNGAHQALVTLAFAGNRLHNLKFNGKAS
ncbi:MAG: hypothetical protein AAFY11_10340 [Cyanobacteria bacterium J06641_5]